MQSVITSKFQTTIPKKIREELSLSVHDALDWQLEKGKIVISPIHYNFLEFQNSIKVGQGDIDTDRENAKKIRVDKYK